MKWDVPEGNLQELVERTKQKAQQRPHSQREMQGGMASVGKQCPNGSYPCCNHHALMGYRYHRPFGIALYQMTALAGLAHRGWGTDPRRRFL